MSNDRSRNRLSDRKDRVPIGGLLRKSRSMLDLRAAVNDDVLLVADGLMADDMVVDVYRVLTPDALWLDAVDVS